MENHNNNNIFLDFTLSLQIMHLSMCNIFPKVRQRIITLDVNILIASFRVRQPESFSFPDKFRNTHYILQCIAKCYCNFIPTVRWAVSLNANSIVLNFFTLQFICTIHFFRFLIFTNFHHHHQSAFATNYLGQIPLCGAVNCIEIVIYSYFEPHKYWNRHPPFKITNFFEFRNRPTISHTTKKRKQSNA